MKKLLYILFFATICLNAQSGIRQMQIDSFQITLGKAASFYQNGAFRLFPTDVSDITNQAFGMFVTDSINNKLKFYDYTGGWKNILLEGDSAAAQDLNSVLNTGSTADIGTNTIDISSGNFNLDDDSNLNVIRGSSLLIDQNAEVTAQAGGKLLVESGQFQVGEDILSNEFGIYMPFGGYIYLQSGVDVQGQGYGLTINSSETTIDNSAMGNFTVNATDGVKIDKSGYGLQIKDAFIKLRSSSGDFWLGENTYNTSGIYAYQGSNIIDLNGNEGSKHILLSTGPYQMKLDGNGLLLNNSTGEGVTIYDTSGSSLRVAEGAMVDIDGSSSTKIADGSIISIIEGSDFKTNSGSIFKMGVNDQNTEGIYLGSTANTIDISANSTPYVSFQSSGTQLRLDTLGLKIAVEGYDSYTFNKERGAINQFQISDGTGGMDWVGYTAVNQTYDNTTSGLSATNTKSAIDEVNTKAELTKTLTRKLITNASVTGTYNLDYSNFATQYLTLTGNTTLTQSNLPTSTEVRTVSLYVTGNYTLTLPAAWSGKVKSGTYDGTKLNLIVVQVIGTSDYWITINN